MRCPHDLLFLTFQRMKKGIDFGYCRIHPVFFLYGWLSFSFGLNRDYAAVGLSEVFTFTERYRAFNKGIKRMITAHSDILARIVSRTTLTDDDIACLAILAAPNLNT